MFAKARDQATERDARLHPRDVHAGAGVVAMTEGDVAVGIAADVEAFGVGKLRRVAVGRADANRDEASCGQRGAAEPHRRGEARDC